VKISRITDEQAKDTGMAMVLICLLLGFFRDSDLFFKLAIPLLLIDMVWPKVYRPLGVLWFGLAHVLGTVMSKVILTVLFFVLVTPIGLLRKAAGADSMQIKKWKKDSSSVFKVRNYTFLTNDIEKPY